MTWRDPNPEPRFSAVALFAFAYFVAGQLGLLLAIPPGYATVVWPASGIALAGVLIYGPRLWAAVFIGSFAVNVSTGFDASSLYSVAYSLLLAVAIAAGSSAQAIVSAFLVRRFVGFPGPFGRVGGVLAALGLAGPVGCLVSATVGVAVLTACGRIEPTSIVPNWLTWWGGDAIGVLIAMPIIQVVTLPRQNNKMWRAAWVVLPMAMSIVGAVAIHQHLRQLDINHLQQQFEREAQTLEVAVENQVRRASEPLQVTSTAMTYVRGITRHEFRNLTERLLIDRPALTALTWAPLVPLEKRAEFEAARRHEGFPDFVIVERDHLKRIVPALDRDMHCPLLYLEPFTGPNLNAHGFDVLSDPIRREVVLTACDSGELTVTPPLSLVQDVDQRKAIVLLWPVYTAGCRPSDIVERRARWAGVVAAVVRLNDLLSEVRKTAADYAIAFSLEDMTNGQAALSLASADLSGATICNLLRPYQSKLAVGQRRWIITYWPTDQFVSANFSYASWAALAGALILTSGLGVFALVVTGRAAAVEEIVTQQTAELRVAKQTAEVASRSKSEFLANMSHEIRTPLNSILGMTELIQESPLTPDQKTLIANVQTSGGHLLEIINDILDFSKIEAGKLQLDHTPFRFRDCVNQTLQMLQTRAESRNLSLSSTICAGVPESVAGDPSRLRQILLNLVGNALKFTHQGSVSVRVNHLTSDKAQVVLHCTVLDTGIGIPPDKLEAIFSPFEQADGSTTRNYGGTGLGLSIVHSLVSMMNGRAWVESEVGRGSAFHFVVTLEQCSAPASEQSRVVLESAAVKLHRPLSILVADDNTQNQLLIRRLLEKQGHVVTEVPDGQSAAELALLHRFDLILMDMQMPRMGGLEATAVVRQGERESRRSRTPIVALTANAMEGDRESCLRAGMDGYVSKPFRREVLYGEIARVVSVATEIEPPTTVPAPPDDGCRQILEQVDNCAELLQEMVDSYRDMAPGLVEELSDAAAAGDVLALRHTAHKLRGSTGMFGESTLLLSLDAIERAARETPARCDHARIEQIHEELNALLGHLRRATEMIRSPAPTERLA